jgi:hypothetical protein
MDTTGNPRLVPVSDLRDAGSKRASSPPSPVASVYQIATNSRESSTQCIAKTVAPKAPARSPAAAPITAGDIDPTTAAAAIGANRP